MNQLITIELRAKILKEHSRKQVDRIISWVGQDQKRFAQLMHLFLTDEYRVVQRAAWPLSDIAIAHPILVKKYLPKIILNLQQPGISDAVKRNSLRLLQFVETPVRLHGRLMSYCFDCIAEPKEKPAIKAFSLTILNNLSEKYPEIRSELKTLIEERWDSETPAFRARARPILRRIGN